MGEIGVPFSDHHGFVIQGGRKVGIQYIVYSIHNFGPLSLLCESRQLSPSDMTYIKITQNQSPDSQISGVMTRSVQ